MDHITIKQCQDFINKIFYDFLFLNHNVRVCNSDSNQIIALAYNTNYVQYSLIPPNAQGDIVINLQYLIEKDFDLHEIFFILAHESMHIFLNHSLNRKIWEQVLKDLRGSENDPVRYAIVDILRVMSSIFSEQKVPLDVDSIMRDEFAADELAIRWVTKNPAKAISCLKKLVNQDLSTASHTWEFYGEGRTIMTMEVRINKLEKIFKPSSK